MVTVQFIRLGILEVPIQYLRHRGFLERYWSSVCIGGPKKLSASGLMKVYARVKGNRPKVRFHSLPFSFSFLFLCFDIGKCSPHLG